MASLLESGWQRLAHKSLPMVYIKPSGICLNIGKHSVSLLYSKTTAKTETTTSKTIPNFGVSSNVLVCPFNSTKGHLGSSFQLAQYLTTNFSDFQLATFGTFIIHESIFFLSGFPSIFLERSGLFSKYKIQGAKVFLLLAGIIAFDGFQMDKIKNYALRRVRALVLAPGCFPWIMGSLVGWGPFESWSYIAFRYMGLKSSLPLPSWSVVISQVVFYFILEDFVFYWGHRMLHTKWLYQHVHSVHHEYATPFGLTSEYAHPAEILMLGFGTILGPALTGPHLLTLWVWMSLRVVETVEAHCGYDFPWSPSKFLPLYGGAEFHDFHHRVLYTQSGNYSSTFTYMDWLFGTDRDYWKQKSLESINGKEF